ncbi:MAG: S46 family peptidase [Deltaproteobacteria bacterium]|nr:MAG: S46 family peptidase [Deltaproteobacteria bacterium]
MHLSPRRARFVSSATLAAIASTASPARADEGPWPPDQLPQVMDAALADRGFELSAEELWNEGGGLLRAAVRLGGCSASFVSPDGLIATNHHCAYGAIQGLASVDRDLLTDGFLARDRSEELRAPGTTVRIVHRIEDVSDRFDALLDEHEDDAALAEAYDDLREELASACEKGRPDHRCVVASFFGGRVHRLFDYLEIRDVRLVYAPPSAIGEYGGEVDNWMWPRHTGDFSLMRAYVGPGGKPADPADENVPYRPEHYLTIAAEGIEPGQTVAVLGYPGRTRRHVPLAEVERYRDQVYPMRAEFYGKLLDVLHGHADRDPAVAIKVAARIKSLENRRKNARGMLDGFRRNGLIERRRRIEAKLEELARERGADYVAAFGDLAALSEEERRDFPLRFLLSQAGTVSHLVGLALTVLRHAEYREEHAGDTEAIARRRKRLERSIERAVRDFDPRVEADLLEVWSRALSSHGPLPPDLAAALARADRIATRSRMAKPGVARELLDAPPEKLARDPDPALALARAIRAAEKAAEPAVRRRRGRSLRALPRYVELLQAATDGPFYPDANGTLRVSFATVRGYDPEDGLRALPQTTLSGAVAKHTDTPPFDLPDSVLAAAAEAPNTYWADPVLKDVPVCFLTDADTTGGNSGSAVVDGKGRLVGLNFDRVWHNVVGDFGYSEEKSRNIVVDVRFLLWLLDDVVHADALLGELGVAGYAQAGRRPAPPRGDGRDAERPPSPAAPKAEEGRGCRCAAGPTGAEALLPFMVLTCSYRRRRFRRC